MRTAKELTKSDLQKAAKLRSQSKTWGQIREALGCSVQSGQFQRMWAKAGIDAVPSRDLNTAQRLATLAENRAAREAAAAKAERAAKREARKAKATA